MQSLFIHSYITWLIFHVRGIPVRLHSKELHRFLTNEHNWRKEFCKNPLLVLRLHALFNVCRKPCKIIIMHSFSCGVAVTVYTLLHIWLDLIAFHTHKIKLTILPKILNCWLNTLSYSTACLDQKSRVLFLWQFSYLWPCVSLECSLGMVFRWLGKPWRTGQCLSSQFGMLWAQGRSSKALNRTSGFQLSYSIYTSYTMCNIITFTKKAAQNCLNLGYLKVMYPHNYS